VIDFVQDLFSTIFAQRLDFLPKCAIIVFYTDATGVQA
jgi:hypothetical protein